MKVRDFKKFPRFMFKQISKTRIPPFAKKNGFFQEALKTISDTSLKSMTGASVASKQKLRRCAVESLRCP